ncbi:hypothetical protein V7x_46730 [Crateriforma conspicua]|uniref:Uncharacterized protein n=1 Tax=Crateriforma conspicua TaxID=2527996 RepID=A0A5C6FR16_9PLAN|nr:hypothetical protein V7x_46730 [Crateriforma conspicua]
MGWLGWSFSGTSLALPHDFAQTVVWPVVARQAADCSESAQRLGPYGP